MGRLFSVFGPTIALFGVMYMVAELSRWLGKMFGVVSKPKEVAMLMDQDVKRISKASQFGSSLEHRYLTSLRTWIQSK